MYYFIRFIVNEINIFTYVVIKSLYRPFITAISRSLCTAKFWRRPFHEHSREHALENIRAKTF